MEIDYQKPKRRYKKYEKTVNGKNLESKKWKPYRSRAIQRARDLKQSDNGRGEEAPLNSEPEELNARMSSREAFRFKVVQTYKEAVDHYTTISGIRIKTNVLEARTKTVASGIYYHAPGKEDIVVVHMLNGEKVHLYAEMLFCYFEEEIYRHLCMWSGDYNTVIY